MPVNTEHSEYKKRKKQWERCRSCINGSDAIKDAGQKYLPKLQDQTNNEYEAYLERALFYGATSRTLQGLLGAVFRKDFTYEYPEIYIHQLDDVTPEGNDLWEFSRQVVKETIGVGRMGILIDVDKSEDMRAYCAIYKAEKIVNWRTEKIGGRRVLTMVILEEEYEDPGVDIFEKEIKTQYRVLEIGLNENQSMQYIQEIWRKIETSKGSQWAVYDTIYPTRQGLPLDEIPFIFVNAHNLLSSTDKPPLLDLAEVNLSHFRTSADLEHGAHYTALPTAWVAGFPADSELRIGSGVAWVSENTSASAGYLEFKGQGLGSLQDLKKDKEQLMAILGARLLEDQKRAVEAADTHKIRQSGESGALTTITRTVSNAIKAALKLMAWWSGASDQQIDGIEFMLNDDFMGAKMTPQELTALMQAWQQGAISQTTFLHNLKEGEILPDGISIDDEKELIGTENDNNAFGTDNTNVIPIGRTFELDRDQQGRATRIREID